MLNQADRSALANRVTISGSIINLLLMIFKLYAGIIGKSSAMIADAVHSMSDFVTDIVVLASFWITKKPEDKTHDYGHGKFETLATLIVGIALFIVASGIGYSGFKNVIDFIRGRIIEKPGVPALIAAVISIITKELLYRWTFNTGKKINSQAVIANAWHHRSDAFSSIGTCIGISGAILLGEKWHILDPLAGIIVSFFIMKVAVEIFLKSINELLECSLSEKEKQEILNLIKSVRHAHDPHKLKTRRIGNNISLDFHIRINPDMKIKEGHEIATIIENTIREKYGPGTFISIHIEPGR